MVATYRFQTITIFEPKMRVELYVEIDNIPSIPLSNGTNISQYETRLESKLKLHDSNGKIVPILNKSYQSTTMLSELRIELTQSQIHDYFLVFNFNVPSEPGNYMVTLEISDTKKQSLCQQDDGLSRSLNSGLKFQV